MRQEKKQKDETVRAFESSMRKILKEESTFQRFGMRMVHKSLSTGEVRKRLGSALKIDVMKTWFPDHPDIREGLFNALKNPHANVRLLLSDPDSPLLSVRSKAAVRDEGHGSREVVNTVVDICQLALAGKIATFQIGLHKEWPGCPIIWYDCRILLGFYFRGRASPFWPWIEIEAGSDFDDKILRPQFDDLWKKKETRIMSERLQLLDWLKERGIEV